MALLILQLRIVPRTTVTKHTLATDEKYSHHMGVKNFGHIEH